MGANWAWTSTPSRGSWLWLGEVSLNSQLQKLNGASEIGGDTTPLLASRTCRA